MGCRVLNADGTVQTTCSQFPTLANLVLLTTGLFKVPGLPAARRYRMDDWQRDDERDVEVVSGCYLMVRREAMEAVGLLDEDFFFFGEETDWCRRFLRTWLCRALRAGRHHHPFRRRQQQVAQLEARPDAERGDRPAAPQAWRHCSPRPRPGRSCLPSTPAAMPTGR